MKERTGPWIDKSWFDVIVSLVSSAVTFSVLENVFLGARTDKPKDRGQVYKLLDKIHGPAY